MMSKYLSLSIAIVFFSFIVGMIIYEALKKSKFFSNNLQNLNFIKSNQLNKIIGIGVIKWIVKNTFFKFFNQKLKLKSKVEKTDLNKLRNEMTKSEIEHLIGFVFVTIFALVKFYTVSMLFASIMMIVNILMNLYPSLLQQMNKRRIDELIKKISLT